MLYLKLSLTNPISNGLVKKQIIMTEKKVIAVVGATGAQG